MLFWKILENYQEDTLDGALLYLTSTPTVYSVIKTWENLKKNLVKLVFLWNGLSETFLQKVSKGSAETPLYLKFKTFAHAKFADYL